MEDGSTEYLNQSCSIGENKTDIYMKIRLIDVYVTK